MMGNVYEWNESLSGSSRGIRGGSYGCGGYGGVLSSSDLCYDDPGVEYNGVGFRVASIPEPASAAIMTLASLFIALKRRKR